MKYLKDKKFRKANDLHAINEEVKTTKNQMSGNKATLRNLNSRIDKLDNESIKQQEVIYSQVIIGILLFITLRCSVLQ